MTSFIVLAPKAQLQEMAILVASGFRECVLHKYIIYFQIGLSQ